MGLLAVLAVSAIASASALASAPQWYVNGVLLTGSLNIESLGIGNTVLKGKIAGVAAEIECVEQRSAGTIENGGTLILALGLLLWHYLRCVVHRPSGCIILHELLFFHLHIDIGIILGIPWALYTPSTGSTLGLVPIRGCAEEANYPLEGEAFGLIHDAASSIGFEDKGVNDKLKLGGKEAELEADELVLMEGGGAIEAK
ncbi:MAG: hypothetical protein ACLPUT_00825 [Solirubrobacteraceae bacterium]